MPEQHPITPPPNLVRQWIDEPQYMTEDQLGKRMYMISLNEVKFREIISKASQYGADQELEACYQHVDWVIGGLEAKELRAARRAKPPSLKEQAIAALNEIEDHMLGPTNQEKLIRRALEALDD